MAIMMALLILRSQVMLSWNSFCDANNVTEAGQNQGYVVDDENYVVRNLGGDSFHCLDDNMY
jgi:hypothetical protein